MIKNIIFPTLFLALLGCNKPRVLKMVEADTVEVLSIDEGMFELSLNNSTSLFNFLNETIYLNGKSKLLVFSQNSNSLLQYDIQSKSLEKTVSFPKEGPDALTGLDFSSGMHYLNKDSILFFSSDLGRFFLANDRGKVYSRFNVLNDSIVLGSFDIRSKLAFRNGSVFVQSLPKVMGRDKSEYSDRPITISEYNLKSKKLTQHQLKLTDVYREYDFSQQLQSIEFVYSKHLDKFIVSYPLVDSLYILDFKGAYETIPAKSNLVKQAFEIDTKNREIPPSSLTSYYNWISDSYGRLLYDHKTGYIFRVARSGISHDQFIAKDFYAKKEVIVIDPEYRTVGVIPHSGSTLMYHVFDQEGISWNANFKQYNISKGNEDILYFKKFRLY